MDITGIIQQLREQRDAVIESILALERISAGSPRRGRPPKWIAAAKATETPVAVAPKRRGRPPGSGKKSSAK